MASTTSQLLPHQPFSTSRKMPETRRRSVVFSRTISASKRDGSGHIVDENMIILRKRIHEMKMIERNYEPPSDWMDWEKRYYTSYDTYICEAMGFLQSQLMNTRPSLALGVMALITISVLMSSAVIISDAMEIIAKGVLLLNGVLGGIHLG